MKRTALGPIAVAIALAGCHTITEELPTEPTKTPPAGVLTVPIPSLSLAVAPTPKATPTPTATPAPAPPPAPTPAPEATPTPSPTGSGCGDPLPPPVAKMQSYIHIRGANRYTLDTTPLVGPDADYCRKIGFTDGRRYCPARPEGAPDRVACEEYLIGRAIDTGRPGPTWYRDGQLCAGGACENHEDNQFLLYAYSGGNYSACTRDGLCGEVQVDR